MIRLTGILELAVPISKTKRQRDKISKEEFEDTKG